MGLQHLASCCSSSPGHASRALHACNPDPACLHPAATLASRANTPHVCPILLAAGAAAMAVASTSPLCLHFPPTLGPLRVSRDMHLTIIQRVPGEAANAEHYMGGLVLLKQLHKQLEELGPPWGMVFTTLRRNVTRFGLERHLERCSQPALISQLTNMQLVGKGTPYALLLSMPGLHKLAQNLAWPANIVAAIKGAYNQPEGMHQQGMHTGTAWQQLQAFTTPSQAPPVVPPSPPTCSGQVSRLGAGPGSCGWEGVGGGVRQGCCTLATTGLLHTIIACVAGLEGCHCGLVFVHTHDESSVRGAHAHASLHSSAGAGQQ